MPLLRLEVRLPVECRRMFAAGLFAVRLVGFAVLLGRPVVAGEILCSRAAFSRPRVVSRGFVLRRFMSGRFPTRRKRSLFWNGLALRGAFERLDPDRIFLVGALDHGGEGFSHRFR